VLFARWLSLSLTTAGSVGYQFDSTSGDAYNYQFATPKSPKGANHRDHCSHAEGNQAPAGCEREANAFLVAYPKGRQGNS